MDSLIPLGHGRWVWSLLLAIAVAACIFIRATLSETMPNPKPYAGHRELCADVLPCARKAGRQKEGQDTKGYGFALFVHGPDGKGDTSADAMLRRRSLRTLLLLISITGIGGGYKALQPNYLVGGLHLM